MHSQTHFEIEQLRMRNLVDGVMSILGILAALLVVILLPSLLVRYVIPQEQLLTEPLILELIPVVGFVLSFGYFLYAAVRSFQRAARARALEASLAGYGEMVNDSEMISEAELAELEGIVEEALKSKSAKTTRKAASAKKSTRKTPAKRTARARKSK